MAGGCLLISGATPVYASGASAAVAAAYAQDRDDRDRGWEAPPGELDEVARRGFHDGIEGARRDYQNHRRPDVNNRDEYRHPHMPHRDREAYRRGFERGYHVGVEHIYERR